MIRQNRREKLKGWSRLFSTKQMIQTKDLRPGMILSDDNFMKGLTEKEIKDIHGTMGLDATICIKQAYPFIPVIFMSFLIFIAITLTGIVKI